MGLPGRASMAKHLLIGGLVAAGFDPTGADMLVVSNSGRGVFATSSWEKIARDSSLAYPEKGHAVGIGPIEGVCIPAKEKDYVTGVLRFSSPDGKTCFVYEDGTLTVSEASA